jgi:two-component system, cell cycle response regulator
MEDSQTPDDFEITLVTKQMLNIVECSSSEKQGTLTVLLGGQVGAAFALSSRAILIGRNPRAQVPVEDDGVSRSHARVFRRADGVYEIEDTASTNGTFVDDVRVEGRVALQDGARVRIGNTLLRFAMQDEIEWEASKRVYEASVRDGLTRAFNRRYFEERLISEFAFAARHGSALCVLLVDIDEFKRVNDRYGHQCGDLVLRTIGAELRTALRTEDVLARYGGEEFAVLARGIAASGARMLAERLRSTVERTRMEWEGQSIAVTISVGLAHNHSGAAATDPHRLVAAADKALYAAKDAGRNRIEVARSPGRYVGVEHEELVILSPAAQAKQRVWEVNTAPQDESHEPVRLPPDLRHPPKTPKG